MTLKALSLPEMQLFVVFGIAVILLSGIVTASEATSQLLIIRFLYIQCQLTSLVDDALDSIDKRRTCKYL